MTLPSTVASTSPPTTSWSYGYGVLLLMLASRLRFLAQMAATYAGR